MRHSVYTPFTKTHVSYNLNSLKGGYIGIIYGTTIGVIKGDTRSLDYSSCDLGQVSRGLIVVCRLWNGDMDHEDSFLQGWGRGTTPLVAVATRCLCASQRALQSKPLGPLACAGQQPSPYGSFPK